MPLECNLHRTKQFAFALPCFSKCIWSSWNIKWNNGQSQPERYLHPNNSGLWPLGPESMFSPCSHQRVRDNFLCRKSCELLYFISSVAYPPNPHIQENRANISLKLEGFWRLITKYLNTGGKCNSEMFIMLMHTRRYAAFSFFLLFSALLHSHFLVLSSILIS